MNIGKYDRAKTRSDEAVEKTRQWASITRNGRS